MRAPVTNCYYSTFNGTAVGRHPILRAIEKANAALSNLQNGVASPVLEISCPPAFPRLLDPMTSPKVILRVWA